MIFFSRLYHEPFWEIQIQNIQQWWWSIFLLDFIKVCFLYFRTWLLGVQRIRQTYTMWWNSSQRLPWHWALFWVKFRTLKATNSGFSWSFSGSITHQINSQLGKMLSLRQKELYLWLQLANRYKLELQLQQRYAYIMKSGSVPYVKLPSSSEVDNPDHQTILKEYCQQLGEADLSCCLVSNGAW